MAKRFKFVLTLPDDIEVDSAVSIHKHMAWPNYSQAEPVFYKGIFDTYEAAEKYASDFEIYKYTTGGYDSFEDEEEPRYFVSIYDAEDAAAAECGIEPGEWICPNPDEYRIEQFQLDGETVYKYGLYYNDKLVFDSYEDDGMCYDSREDAEEAAELACQEYEIEEEGECPYELEKVEILNVRIEEMGDFIIDCGSLIKYFGEDSHVVIPDGVWRIANDVFRDRQNITCVEIPGSVQYIYSGVFSNCTNLETIVFSEGLEKIGSDCFRNCAKLENVRLPKSLEKIYDRAFADCANLKEVIIPCRATTFEGEAVFSGCVQLVLKVSGNSRGKSYARLHNLPYEIIQP